MATSKGWPRRTRSDPVRRHGELSGSIGARGTHRPIAGRDAVKEVWWAPMPGLLGAVTRLATYFDDELTGAVATGEVELMTEPPVRLASPTVLPIDDEGLIVEQENHFDPATSPVPAGRPRRPHRLPGRRPGRSAWRSRAPVPPGRGRPPPRRWSGGTPAGAASGSAAVRTASYGRTNSPSASS